ncbi:hypothetical protein PVK06_045216 [Gossypium arboreum]|uniref:UVR domain-containing protein n=1 Tax=Gossypium arboreum TaxID=29729 RepID=A0ABR0MTG8_GOSAR|nr:hypothetical protein PVK06_045216 [Gossypium arboreum]
MSRSSRISSFSGLRVLNSLDNMVRFGQSFTSKVAISISSQRGRGNRCVTKALFSNFTEKSIKVVILVLAINFFGTEEFLLGLIAEGSSIAAKVLSSMGINLKDTRVEVEKIVGRGHKYIGPEHLLLGLLREIEGVAARVLENLGADLSKIRKKVIRKIAESEARFASRRAASGKKMSMVALEEYGTNLTKLAEEGKLVPVVGRQDQIERVMQILGRRTKNNPCLIGEPGVGKTAIAEGLAQRIASGDIPETIEGKMLCLLYNNYCAHPNWSRRCRGAIDAANILKPALARSEFQCIGATTLDEYRKHMEEDPALERRFQPVKVPEPSVEETLQILEGLRECYEIHHKLRYTDEALISAAHLSFQYLKYVVILFSSSICVAILFLTLISVCFSDRFLPDKAIDLIDEAGSRVRRHHAQLPEEAKDLEKELWQLTKSKNEAVRDQDFEKARELRDREITLRAQITATQEKEKEMNKGVEKGVEGSLVVTEADIQYIVSSWTGIPVEKMEKTLHKRVVGQDEAVKAISRAIRRARVGLKNPNRPIASFIFSGPTGVGKSELAKTLAVSYFGSEEAMIRFDMSEYMERQTVSKLIGPPPEYVGYNEGGQLTEAVRRRPYTVVLFDEIEKAHPDIFNVMLQILEDGRLTDSKGRTVDFKNTLLVMTSNVGSSVIEKGGRRMGFDPGYDEKDSSYSIIKGMVMEELKQLTKLEVKEIANIMLQEVLDRLKGKEIKLQVTERFRERVVEEGYDPSYGARPWRRAIMRLLEDSMAEKMLAGEIEGDSVTVDLDSDGNIMVLNGQ